MRNAARRFVLVLTCSLLAAGAVLADTPPPASAAARQEAERLAKLPPVSPKSGVAVDPSGRKEKGEASYYGPQFSGRTMADGRPMDPASSVAASKTLPLGTTAKVTSLETGKTATVTVQDRGPFVPGRVVDVSPKVAEQLGIKQQGVAPVEVKPITVPQRDGSVKLGAGAAETSSEEVRQAAETSRALAPRREAGGAASQ